MNGSTSLPSAQFRAPLRRSLNRALGVILGCFIVLIGLLLLAVPIDQPGVSGLVIFPIASLVNVVVALFAWHGRPTSLIGPLMLLSAAAMLLAALGNSEQRLLSLLGVLFATLPLATLIHLLLAFPTGRVKSAPERVVIVAGYFTATALQLPEVLWGLESPSLFDSSTQRASLGALVQAAAGAVTFAATLLLFARRLRYATPTERRVLAPLYVFGMVAILTLLAASQLMPRLFGWSSEATAYLQLSVLTVVPIAVAVAALYGGVARTTELEEAGEWLAQIAAERAGIQTVLSRVLGDPSLELWYWDAKASRYLDSQGARIDVLLLDHRRHLQSVELDGQRIGALVYDPALIPEIESVQTASRAVALALDRERLTALLQANRADLQQSRERLVEAADAERRRIARDLHDGLQAELVLLGIQAQRLARNAHDNPEVADRALQLRRSIDRSAAGLRDLVHAVMPASLVQRGLAAATEDLADRMPIPVYLHVDVDEQILRPAVEGTVYFVIAEALANVVKHAQAQSVSVRIECRGGVLYLTVSDDGRGGAQPGPGLGLTGMRERLSVLGGALDVQSPVGRGTVVRAEVPYE